MQEAASEVAYAANFVEWYAEEAKRIQGEVIASFDPNRRTVVRQPIGVCAAITPWNFPLAMVTRKVAPALAAGAPWCSSQQDKRRCRHWPQPNWLPLRIATRGAERHHRQRSARHGPRVVRKPGGAPPQLHRLHRSGAQTDGAMRAHHQETGARTRRQRPLYRFEDADIDSAVSGAMSSKFRNADVRPACAPTASTCKMPSTTVLWKSWPKKCNRCTWAAADPGVTQGPLIDRAAMEKVRLHVGEDALAHGARLLAGGQALRERFFAPTLVADATSAMPRCARESVRPAGARFVFTPKRKPIAAASRIRAGLLFLRRDMGRITRVSEALEYGMVGVNTGMLGSRQVPFGGIKQSGLGREGSRHGMEEYLEMKLVVTGDVLA